MGRKNEYAIEEALKTFSAMTIQRGALPKKYPLGICWKTMFQAMGGTKNNKLLKTEILTREIS